MLHNYRRTKRFPITGKATLIAGSKAITGRIVDISSLGVALADADAPPRRTKNLAVSH